VHRACAVPFDIRGVIMTTNQKTELAIRAAQRAAVATWLGEKPIRPHAKRPRPRRGARHPGADAAKDHSGLLPEH